MAKELTPQQKGALTRKRNQEAKARAEAEASKSPDPEVEIPEVKLPEEDKSESKTLWWASPVFIPTIGTVKGIIQPRHWQIFCSIATNPDTQRRHAVDYDPEERAKRDAKQAVKKRLGIR
jgi:hypothetical protein